MHKVWSEYAYSILEDKEFFRISANNNCEKQYHITMIRNDVDNKKLGKMLIALGEKILSDG